MLPNQPGPAHALPLSTCECQGSSHLPMTRMSRLSSLVGLYKSELNRTTKNREVRHHVPLPMPTAPPAVGVFFLESRLFRTRAVKLPSPYSCPVKPVVPASSTASRSISPLRSKSSRAG